MRFFDVRAQEFVKRWTLSHSVEHQQHNNRWWIHRAAAGIRPTEESFQHRSSRFHVWLTLPASLPALHLHLKNTAASAAAAAPWSWEVTFPPQQEEPVRERNRERSAPVAEAQLGLSVEFRNGMLTAHPDPSSSSQQRRRGGPNAAGIFGSSLQETFHSLHMIYHEAAVSSAPTIHHKRCP